MKSSFSRDKPANGSSIKVIWTGRESISLQTAPTSYSSLTNSLVSAYQVNPDSLKLLYKDEDGDQASLFDEESYHMALKHCKGPRLLLTLDLYPEHWLKEGSQKRPVPINFRKMMEFYRRNQSRMGTILTALYRKVIKNKCEDVREVALDNQNAGVEEAQKLAVVLPAFNRLQKLSIRNGAIKEEGIEALAKALKVLDDYKTALSEGLRPITHMISLNFSGNQLGAAGFAALTRVFPLLSELQTLKLDGNGLRSEGGELLGRAIPHLRRLENLGLDDNSLGDMGLSALASGLPALFFLKVVWLEGNRIGLNGAVELARNLPHSLEFLWLSRNPDLNILAQRTLLQAAGSSCTLFFS